MKTTKIKVKNDKLGPEGRKLMNQRKTMLEDRKNKKQDS